MNQQLAERLSPAATAAGASRSALSGRGAAATRNSFDSSGAPANAHLLMHSASTPNAPASFVVSGNDLQRQAVGMAHHVTSSSSQVSQQQLGFAPASSSRHAATVQQHYANISATSSLTSQSSVSVAGSALADVIQLSSVNEGLEPSLALRDSRRCPSRTPLPLHPALTPSIHYTRASSPNQYQLTGGEGLPSH